MTNKLFHLCTLASVALVVATLGYAQVVDPITINMGEVPFGPVNGLTVKGVTFTDTSGANIDAPDGGQQQYTQDPVIEGQTAGETLTMTFAQPVGNLQFGVSLSTAGSLTAGFTVTLFDVNGLQIGAPIPVNTSQLPGDNFTEGLFVYGEGIPVKKAVVTFASNLASAFGLDNVTFGLGAYQVKYFSNLTAGDSVINISNTGALNAGLQSGTTASVTGAVCANVYVFSPDEEFVSCCSCPVTPNGLVSLSAVRDLISNPLTPATPTSITVGILATVPVGGTCSNSAGAVSTATLAPGTVAWGTTLHPAASAGYKTTETSFTQATLTAAELARLSYTCGAALAQGSGFGICASCRLGGLGAAAQ